MIPAADSFDEIRASIERIRKEENPTCPRNASTSLYNCLRTTQRCSEECPYHSEWIGPDAV